MPPILSDGEVGEYADPLPQAMALTAIVITFAILAFLLALAYRSWTITHDDEVEDDVEDRRIARHDYEQIETGRPRRARGRAGGPPVNDTAGTIAAGA